ncbi:PREDICTED: uncharacterized protein LOC108769021 [Trachymyrmex cornetzi]|uniref:uncharacterized protein LOC108769021 n=1 Tax=Trachymyrmex cornetzi TaxID=471704 RepID=UPI00084F2658|nr:PREDICTED: uncharacterized protein LOC108769021 [Trachymyrmex cornetzi]
MSTSDLEQCLTKFWDFEHNISDQTLWSPNDHECEEHFLRTIKQNSEGRFIVTLPIKTAQSKQLGESKNIALKRFRNLEKRFKHNDQLKIEYTSFMQEYFNLGHMQLVDDSTYNNKTSFYLPHHCVFKASGIHSKLRVVFDGSCKSDTGVSLNDILMVGPVVQSDLFSLLARFWSFKYVFTADVVKMYRQILVDPTQTSLQSILWRENVDDPVSTYQLTTVTYGSVSAPYLATRCLKYLAELHQRDFPEGARAIINDVYVDDLLTGAHSLADASAKRNQIIEIMSKGCFTLDKWFSNCIELLEGISNNKTQDCVSINENYETRILGLQWNPYDDSFRYTFDVGSMHSNIMKRNMLSEISRLFDPLGWVAPIILLAKLMIQELWKLQLHWDASVPADMHSSWLEYKKQMPKLSELRIPRMIGVTLETLEIQFHGFADASQHAYGACCYIRTCDTQMQFQTRLLASKSRVASTKEISLPRLELCAALLLAQLQDKLLKSIDIQPYKIFLWTDSTITLSWIRARSRRFSVFVSNHIGEIQRLTELKVKIHVVRQESDVLEELIVKYSSFDKLVRVISYIFQFINNCRNPFDKRVSTVNEQNHEHALQVLCKYIQQRCFSQEIHDLTHVGTVSNTSKILSLNPLLDQYGVLRVGGRLKHADLDYKAKHPILLPKNHTITKLIIHNKHVKNLHAGVQATIYAVRNKFWPISVKVTARNVIKKCITCFKLKPGRSQVIMSDLSSARVSLSHPFAHTGLDFGGPFIIREHKRRNAKLIKAYICIFVCFATKAVHIELVADLSSDAFLGALKKFMARRSKVICLYSDNATNFVGAAREISDLHKLFCEEQTKRRLNNFFTEMQIQWQMIPPNAPHFGGLWEAAIKSAKYHMKRIIGNTSLNYDEMSTVIAEIEAILNSRPISPMSDDPNDIQALTPGHFLIGQPVNSYAYSDLENIKINQLSRWQLVERLRQHFWQRWRNEYLNTLQGRTKWKMDKGDPLRRAN